MKHNSLITSLLIPLTLMITFDLSAQQIPAWFQKNMKASIGTWTAGNEPYQSDQEPFDAYGMEWEWGIGRQSIVGTLYGLLNGKKQAPFWEFRQYWDPAAQQGIIMQFGGDGTFGAGPIIMKPDSLGTESIQVFTAPDGSHQEHGHISRFTAEGKLITTSYHIGSDASWTKRRSYVWSKPISGN